MKKINNYRKYKLESITDLCSSNGLQNPEFRITEIKSAMRFWWRALNFFENISDMKIEEEKIFGGSEKIACKSPIILKFREKNKSSDECGKHIVRKKDTKEYTIPCFKSGKIVELELILKERKLDKEKFLRKELEFYDALLRISLILGGIGKRSRRGCGVFNISSETNKSEEDKLDILSKIKKYMEVLGVKKYYNFDNNRVSRIEDFNNKSVKYPYIEEILIHLNSSTEEDFYEKIKKSIDKTRKENLQYKTSRRFACPIYVTCYGDKAKLYPIIVKLHNTDLKEAKNTLNQKYNQYYNVFKDVILCKTK